MAVQINEVIIKAVVDPRAHTITNEPECPPGANGGAEAEIAEQILQIIREKKNADGPVKTAF